MKISLSDMAASAMASGLEARTWCGVDELERLVVINVGPNVMSPRLQGKLTVREARELMAELESAVRTLDCRRRDDVPL